MSEALWNKFHESPAVTILEEGIYDFTVERIIELSDNSILLGFNVSGKSIAQRIYFDSNECTAARYLLASVGILKDINGTWITNELANTVGKSGRCIVGQYQRNGMDDNFIVVYLAPWGDENDQWWRYQVIKKAGNRCENCGEYGNVAHHLLPKSRYPNQRYNIENGQCLCHECHKRWHDTYGIMAVGGPGL